jgi:hypothetical protein
MNRKEILMKMNEELEQLLKNLKLGRVLEVYEEQLRAADKEDVTYTEFAVRLLRAQWHTRQETALEWRIRRAICFLWVPLTRRCSRCQEYLKFRYNRPSIC